MTAQARGVLFLTAGAWLAISAGAATGQAPAFGVTVRTRNSLGDAADRIRVQTDVDIARVAFTGAYLGLGSTQLPPSPLAGDVYYDTASNTLRYYDGATWIVLGAAGGGVASVTASAPLSSTGGVNPVISLAGIVATSNGGTGLDTSGAPAGALLRRSAAGAAWETMAAGAPGKLLGVSGGVPSWVDPPVSSVAGNTGPVGFSAGTGLSVTPSGVNPVVYSLANTGVSPNTYTNATVTVDAQGRITSASDGVGAGGVASVTASAPLASTGGVNPVISLAGIVAASKGGTGLDTSGAPAGALLRRNAAGAAWETMAAGAPGKLLGVSGGVPSWVDPPVSSVAGNTGPVGFSAGTGLSVTPSGVNPVVYSLANTGVSPNTYTNATVTVDAQGRITSASSGAVGIVSVTASAPLSSTGGVNPMISLAGIVAASNGGTGLDTSGAPAGTLLRTTAAGTWGMLGPGDNGQVLTMQAGLPQWTNPSGGAGVLSLNSVVTGAASLVAGAGLTLVDDDPSETIIFNVGGGAGIAVGSDSIQLDTLYTNALYVNVPGDTMSGELRINAGAFEPDQTALWAGAPDGSGQNAAFFTFGDTTNSSAPTVWAQQTSATPAGSPNYNIAVLGFAGNSNPWTYVDSVGVLAAGQGAQVPALVVYTQTGAMGSVAQMNFGDTYLGADIDGGGPLQPGYTAAVGDFDVFGSKNAVQHLPDGRWVRFSALESRDSEYYAAGTTALVDGHGAVTLEEEFVLGTSPGIDYRILVTPRGPCAALYVSERSHSGFAVAESGGGTSSVEFDWMVIGRRAGYEVRPGDGDLPARVAHLQGAALRVSATRERLRLRGAGGGRR